MREMPRWLLLAVVLCGASSFCAAEDEDSYIVNLQRRIKVAQKATVEVVTAELTTNRRAWDGGKPYVDEQGLGYRFLVDAKTDTPDSEGRAKVFTYKVRSFTVTKEASEKNVLPPGATIVARRHISGDVPRIMVDGKKPSEDVRRALTLVLGAGDDDEHDSPYQELYGSTSARRRIGETWKVDRQGAVQTFRSRGVVVDPDNINGKATLVGLETINGLRCLHVEAVMEVDRFMYASNPTTKPATTRRARRAARRAATQPDAKPTLGEWDSASMSWRGTYFLPLDPDALPPQFSASSSIVFRKHGEKDGHGYSNEYWTQREQHYRIVGPDELPSAAATRPAATAPRP